MKIVASIIIMLLIITTHNSLNAKKFYNINENHILVSEDLFQECKAMRCDRKTTDSNRDYFRQR